MSIIIISIFYIYYLIAVNYYRRELHFRFIAYNKMQGKDKAPISFKKLVLFSAIIVLRLSAYVLETTHLF